MSSSVIAPNPADPSPEPSAARVRSTANPHAGQPCVDCGSKVSEANPLRYDFPSCLPCDTGRKREDLGLKPKVQRPSRGLLVAAKQAAKSRQAAKQHWPFGAVASESGVA